MRVRAHLWIALAGLVAAAGCAREIDDGGSSDVDFTRPKKVVASVFYAAETGDAAHLSGLCDPRGEANAPVQRICAVRPKSEMWTSFERTFARGRIIGEPRVSGDRALINIAYGPDGTEPETIELVRRDGRWYLLGI